MYQLPLDLKPTGSLNSLPSTTRSLNDPIERLKPLESITCSFNGYTGETSKFSFEKKKNLQKLGCEECTQYIQVQFSPKKSRERRERREKRDKKNNNTFFPSHHLVN